MKTKLLWLSIVCISILSLDLTLEAGNENQGIRAWMSRLFGVSTAEVEQEGVVSEGKEKQPTQKVQKHQNKKEEVDVIVRNYLTIGGVDNRPVITAASASTSSARSQAEIFFEASMTNIAEVFNGGKEFYDNNKRRIWLIVAGMTGVSAYLYLFIKLKKDSWFLSRRDLWSYWRSEKSLGELFEMDEEELVRQILFDIQTKYTKIEEVENFSAPLSVFFRELDKERKKLTNYVWWAKKIQCMHLSKLFLLDWQIVTVAEERLRRLAFLRSRIWNWISGKKVRENNRLLPQTQANC